MVSLIQFHYRINMTILVHRTLFYKTENYHFIRWISYIAYGSLLDWPRRSNMQTVKMLARHWSLMRTMKIWTTRIQQVENLDLSTYEEYPNFKLFLWFKVNTFFMVQTFLLTHKSYKVNTTYLALFLQLGLTTYK